jgi:hypothetical protein
MDEQIVITDIDKIFATGVFLQPVKCTINGIEQWRWVAVGFEDESFFGGLIVDPVEYGDNLEDMLNLIEEE